MLLKYKFSGYIVRIFLITIAVALMACNDLSDNPAPVAGELNSIKQIKIMKGMPNADGAISYYLDGKTKRDLEFTPCQPAQVGIKDLSENATPGDNIDLCPSEESGAKLIAKQSLEVLFYQQADNSIKCCVYFQGSGFNACHTEPGPTCSYGDPQ